MTGNGDNFTNETLSRDIVVAVADAVAEHDHWLRAWHRAILCGLPPDSAEALECGLWPADDVMPEADRRARGARLSPKPVVWRRS